jgi:hypothetical protein
VRKQYGLPRGGEADMATMGTMTGSEHHPTAWYAEMSLPEKKTFWACVAPAALA